MEFVVYLASLIHSRSANIHRQDKIMQKALMGNAVMQFFNTEAAVINCISSYNVVTTAKQNNTKRK